MNLFGGLYDRVMSWSRHPHAHRYLAGISFAESSFFPIPPDAFLIALVIAARHKAFKFALWCSIASVVGGTLGYAIGHWLWWSDPNTYSPLATFFFSHIPGFDEPIFLKVKHLYDEWNFWVVFTAGFTPIPFKVITISAGAFKINFPVFLLASAIGRSARFFLVAYLLWYFGEPIKNFIEKYLNWLSIAFVVLLIGGFILIKYFM